jgi:hypothetical protein
MYKMKKLNIMLYTCCIFDASVDRHSHGSVSIFKFIVLPEATKFQISIVEDMKYVNEVMFPFGLPHMFAEI